MTMLKLAENMFDDIAIGTGDNLNLTYRTLSTCSMILLINCMTSESLTIWIFPFFLSFVTELLNVVKEYKPAQNNTLIKKACEF